MPPDRPAPTDARYHRAGDPWPLYASLEAGTAWAEWSGATGGAIDPRSERRRLWQLEISDLPVLDLRETEARSTLGVGIGDLTGERTRTQAVVARAQARGAHGMIVPSAARPGAWNLVVFPAGFSAVAVGRGRKMRPRPPADAVTPRAGGG